MALTRAADVAEYFEFTNRETGDGRDAPLASRVPDSLSALLARPGRVELEEPLVWTWVNPDNPPGDVLTTIDSVRLVSPVVQQIFVEHLGPADEIQWIAAELELPDGTRLPQWVPHFPVLHDLLSDEGTDWAGNGVPMRYAYSRAKLTGHHVSVYSTRAVTLEVRGIGPISIPAATASDTYVVSAAVVDAMREADVTGALVMVARLMP
ncbi:hypothetical protein [Cellulomonas composti]|uniref:Uncharacterized protein n=1 Tax=Cellulomonas composti TaxID=266130 RepID=A0A511JF36_9CELL|nr:hypothetical protein [Cellulomonas composti]GEL96409.1 hypothetical protein CCO02nite_30670 [Cellulomonas composti]